MLVMRQRWLQVCCFACIAAAQRWNRLLEFLESAPHPTRRPWLTICLAAVKLRIKSVQNIKKITSAMKMVAASKMRKAQAAQVQSVGMPTTFLKLFGEHTSALLSPYQNSVWL